MLRQINAINMNKMYELSWTDNADHQKIFHLRFTKGKLCKFVSNNLCFHWICVSTWLHWIGRRPLQDETRIIWVLEFGVSYIRNFTLSIWYICHPMKYAYRLHFVKFVVLVLFIYLYIYIPILQDNLTCPVPVKQLILIVSKKFHLTPNFVSF